MRIMDLLKSCPYEKVEKKIVLYYGDRNLEEYQKLYQFLKNMTVKKHLKKNFCIFIAARQETEEEADPAVDLFDENDTSIYFDVSGIEEGDERLYSIASVPFEEFIQYSIEKDTLEKFPYESILAHALWEITSYGFENKV